MSLRHPALDEIDHRPWPLPRSPWVMAMSWHDLAFLHWPVELSHVPVGARALEPISYAVNDQQLFTIAAGNVVFTFGPD